MSLRQSFLLYEVTWVASLSAEPALSVQSRTGAGEAWHLIVTDLVTGGRR